MDTSVSSRNERQLLAALLELGHVAPSDNRELAILEDLERRGHVVHEAEAGWRPTESGRTLFNDGDVPYEVVEENSVPRG